MNNNAAKNIAVTAVIAAILIISKFVLHLVPNVEVITPLIIIFTCSMGFKRTFFAVLVFCTADNFLYSFFYIVTIQYFIHWTLLCALAHISKKYLKGGSLLMAMLGLFSALLFWVETPLLHSVLQFTQFKEMLIAGIFFMIPMAAGGFIFTFVAFKPLYGALTRIKYKIFQGA